MKINEFMNPFQIMDLGEDYIGVVSRVIDGESRELELPIDPNIPLNKGYESDEYRLVFEEIQGALITKKWDSKSKRVIFNSIPLSDFLKT